MPISSELRRVKIGLFHPVLIKILIKKEVRSAMKGQRAKYSAYSQWDCCTDFTFRCLVTTICAVSFLLSMKCVLLCEKNGWFAEEILNWLGGNVKHGLQCNADGPCVLISQKAMAMTTTGDIGITPGYVGPPSSLFLMLCGDIESNPGPLTEELIMELGRSLGTRLDNLSTDLQSLRTTITSMSCQISELTKQLQKKEEDIEDVKSRTKGLEGRVEKMEEEAERQQIINRQDNIVFFGIPEKEGRESEDDCVSIMVKLLNRHDPLRRWKSDDMAKAYRVGKKKRGTDQEASGSDRPRPVLVKFNRGSDKRRLISNRTLRRDLHKANVTMNDDLTVKQRDTLKQLRDDGGVAYYRGTRLVSARRRQAVQDSELAAEQTDRFDGEDPMATTQPSQRVGWQRDDWQQDERSGTSPSWQLQISTADNSGARRGPSSDDETSVARSSPRTPPVGRGRGRGSEGCDSGGTPGRRGDLRGFGRGRGSPGSQQGDTEAILQDEGEAESSSVLAGGRRPRTRLQTHKGSSDDRQMASDGRQTQGRIDTMFQRNQHQ